VAVAVTCLTALFGIWMAWLGWRRGATATLTRSIPVLVLSLALMLALRSAWSMVDHFGLVLCAGAGAGVLAAVGAWLALRKWRPRVSDRSRPLRALDHLGGAVIAVICAACICLGLACIGSAAAFAISDDPRQAQDARPQGGVDWTRWIQSASQHIADAADLGVLRHIPGLAEYGREGRAVVIILNAPKEQLARLAKKRGLTSLLDVPEVQASLKDKAFIDGLRSLARGNLAELPGLARSDVVRKLLACPEIREATKDAMPSDFVRDLEALEADHPTGPPK
jgi:hypothetical protein